ncbi:LLM class flavin-dependent oxidoreductase [Fodinicola feengrottensis]|uniref:LLM class flavin-dependent oxidoreductase n=1 Tax=Fodinicola feengrottensis TaxID=435914 RepID=UPI00244290B7|nr:LLM class flavin-dependent oxidoreductase [Fodinicola feengrottensis]
MPNFGPGTDPGVLRDWARTVEGLGFDLLMLSDHLAVTPDVAEQYPAPFYEPFTALSWLAGVTQRVRLGTSVLIVPYRHPLQMARMVANLNQLSGGRLVLGVGVGWAKQEFAALGVSYERRGALTDAHLAAMKAAWDNKDDYRGGQIPIWVGGGSDAAMRRAVRARRRLASVAILGRLAGRAASQIEISCVRAKTPGAGAGAADCLAVDRKTCHRRRPAGR